MGRRPKQSDTYTVEEVIGLVEAIHKNKKLNIPNLTGVVLPNPIKATSSLLEAMADIGFCRRMLRAADCKVFKQNRRACKNELFVRGVIYTYIYDATAAAAWAFFDGIAAAKEKRVCKSCE